MSVNKELDYLTVALVMFGFGLATGIALVQFFWLMQS